MSAFVLATAFANEEPLAAVVRPLGIGIAISLVLVAILRLATRDMPRASLLATTGLVALISLDLLRGLTALVSVVVGSPLVLLATGVIAYLLLATGAVALLTVVRHGMIGAQQLHQGANQAAAILLGTIVVMGSVDGIGTFIGRAGGSPLLTDCPAVAPAPAVSPLPDIYQILLDGYPRADVLAERFGFDNGPFLQALRDDRFVVDDRSHSNYTFTALTFSSMFNMRYLDDLPGLSPVVGQPMRGRSETLDAISHATVFSVFRHAGYRILTTPSGWEHVTTRDGADRFLDHGELTDFERNLVERTWVPELVSWFAGDWFAAQQRSRILNAFSDIASVAEAADEGPLLLFAHIPIPHYPIVLKADGAPLRMGSLRDWGRQVADLGKTEEQYGPAYANQLASANRLVLDAIAAIDASERDRPAVVIVMSDHGYTHDLRRVDPRDRLSNLFAVRTPGKPTLFDGTTTPVNLYRKLLNAYLGRCEPLLPDRYFVSPEEDRRMDFVQVADPESHAEPIFPDPRGHR